MEVGGLGGGEGIKQFSSIFEFSKCPATVSIETKIIIHLHLTSHFPMLHLSEYIIRHKSQW